MVKGESCHWPKKQTPVAGSGAGIVKRIFLNITRDIVFDKSPKIMSYTAEDIICYNAYGRCVQLVKG